MLIPILIALSLNFDTFSVSIIKGAEAHKPTIINSLRVGIIFGIGQACLAAAGVIIGSGFKAVISDLDHWIAFLLLAFVGGKMILDYKSKSDSPSGNRSLSFGSLLPLVIATSIDSLIIGITFVFLKESVTMAVLVIGIVTFVVSFTGFYIGKKLKGIIKDKVKIIGGLVLIFIGMKILIEHLLY